MSNPARLLPDVILSGAVLHGTEDYWDQIHPEDVESLVALVELADVADAHAIVRVRDRDGGWTLVEHRPRIEADRVVLSRADVTDREQERDRAGRTEAYWRTILRNGHESIVVLDPDTLAIRHASDALAGLMGVDAASLVGVPARGLVDERDRDEVKSKLLELDRAESGRVEAELRLRRRVGDPVWMEAVFSDARHDPDVGAIVVNLRDIADRKQAEARLRASEHLFRVLLLHLADGALVVGADQVVTFASERAAEILGCTARQLIGQKVPIRRSERGLVLGGPIEDGAVPPLHLLPAEVAGPDGRWFELVSHDLSGDPVVDGVVLILRDITDRRTEDEKLRRELELDALTGLLNRRGFEDRAAARLDQGEPVGIAFLDLDGFKQVNDTFGHAVGDELLRQVASRLTACLRSDDVAARLGGDEFVVAFAGTSAEVGAALLERVVAAVQDLYEVDGIEVRVGVSAGWSDVRPGQSVADALHEADQRMYVDKRSRR